MQYAIERRRQRHVDADEANAYGLERYLCPVCKEAVFLRRGRVRKAHFAHRPSEGTRECENYHPGGEYAGSGGFTTQVRKPQPLPLYISVDSSGAGRMPWHLDLLIPYDPAAKGMVLVHDGISGRTRVDVSHLPQGGKRIRVRNQIEPYLSSLMGTGEEAYKARFAVPVPGLDPQYGNTFRYSERGGRRLDPGQPLYWGRGYYVVWSRAVIPAWPAAVYCRRLKEYQGWQCACVELPPDDDPDTSRWADEFLAREVRRPPVTLAVVSPLTHRLPDDSLAVEEGSEVIVAVTREHGSAMPSELQVTWPGLRAVETLPLRKEDRLLINLGRVPTGTTIITLSDGEEDQITLVARQAVHVNQSQRAGLLVCGPSGQEQLLPAHSPMADEALTSARDSSDPAAAIVGVSLPFGLPCTLSHRAPDASENEVQRFRWPEDWGDVDPTRLLREFTEHVWRQLVALLSTATHVELDFGNFGSVRLAPAPTVAAASQRLVLSLGLRERLSWLASFPDDPYRDTSISVGWPTSLSLILAPSEARLRATDKSLLGRVVSRGAWPNRLAPHVHAVRAEVCAVLGLD